MIWIEFVACAALVVVTAAYLTRYGDVLAEKTGLGQAWAGAILLASVTSLPELVTGVTAVSWLNAPNLASGAIMGSCLFNLGLIAVMDLAYQPGPILAKAQQGHILSAGLGVLLLGIVATAVLLGPNLNGVGLAGFSLVSLAIALLYGVGARLVSLFEQRRMVEVLHKGAVVRHYEAIPAARAYFLFSLSALIVVVLGVWLAGIGDRLAESTGLSRSFVGNLFLAMSTSLPEVASTLAAVRLGAIDLAISNALGSNLFNIALLPVMDFADGGGNFWASLSSANAFAAVIGMMMTGVAIVSLTYRASPRSPGRLTWDGLTLAAMYVGAMAALYRME